MKKYALILACLAWAYTSVHGQSAGGGGGGGGGAGAGEQPGERPPGLERPAVRSERGRPRSRAESRQDGARHRESSGLYPGCALASLASGHQSIP